METQRVAVIIEDDKDIRDLLNAVLQQAGFKVFTARNGTEGVEVVRTHNPTVVTLDLGVCRTLTVLKSSASCACFPTPTL